MKRPSNNSFCSAVKFWSQFLREKFFIDCLSLEQDERIIALGINESLGAPNLQDTLEYVTLSVAKSLPKRWAKRFTVLGDSSVVTLKASLGQKHMMFLIYSLMKTLKRNARPSRAFL